jgi:hypothetical protein
MILIKRGYATTNDGTLKYHRNGGDSRGNSYARRRRKCKLLTIFGDSATIDTCNECNENHAHKCKCVHCGTELTFTTLEQDRIVPGGKYVIENLQPACSRCNKARSNNPVWQYSSK